jgi:hypothetical protein
MFPLESASLNAPRHRQSVIIGVGREAWFFCEGNVRRKYEYDNNRQEYDKDAVR